MTDFEHTVEVLTASEAEREGVVRFAVDARRVEGWRALGAVVSAESKLVYVLFERPVGTVDSTSLFLNLDVALGGDA